MNMWCFAVYLELHWRSWKGCHFLVHPVCSCRAAACKLPLGLAQGYTNVPDVNSQQLNPSSFIHSLRSDNSNKLVLSVPLMPVSAVYESLRVLFYDESRTYVLATGTRVCAEISPIVTRLEEN